MEKTDLNYIRQCLNDIRWLLPYCKHLLKLLKHRSIVEWDTETMAFIGEGILEWEFWVC